MSTTGAEELTPDARHAHHRCDVVAHQCFARSVNLDHDLSTERKGRRTGEISLPKNRCRKVTGIGAGPAAVQHESCPACRRYDFKRQFEEMVVKFVGLGNRDQCLGALHQHRAGEGFEVAAADFVLEAVLSHHRKFPVGCSGVVCLRAGRKAGWAIQGIDFNSQLERQIQLDRAADSEMDTLRIEFDAVNGFGTGQIEDGYAHHGAERNGLGAGGRRAEYREKNQFSHVWKQIE